MVVVLCTTIVWSEKKYVASTDNQYLLILCYLNINSKIDLVWSATCWRLIKKDFSSFFALFDAFFKFQHTKMLWLPFFPIRFHSCRSLRDTHSVINRYFHRKNGRRDFIDFCHMNATLETINHFVFGYFVYYKCPSIVMKNETYTE